MKNCLIFGKVKHLFPLYNLSLVRHMWLSFYHLLYIRFCQFPWLSQWWINLCLLNQRQTDKGNHQVSLLFYLDLSMFQSGTASSSISHLSYSISVGINSLQYIFIYSHFFNFQKLQLNWIIDLKALFVLLYLCLLAIYLFWALEFLKLNHLMHRFI